MQLAAATAFEVMTVWHFIN